jgi:hypothetical protein
LEKWIIAKRNMKTNSTDSKKIKLNRMKNLLPEAKKISTKKTYRHFFTLLIACFIVITLRAQPTLKWEASLDYKCLSAAPDGFGNTYFLSRTGNLSKIDQNGNTLWMLSLGLTEIGTIYNAKDYVYKKLLAADKLGNVVMAITDRVDPNNANFFYKIIKVSKDGNMLWTQTYNSGTSDILQAVAIDENDNVIVAGRSTKNGMNSDFLIIKYDKDGSQLWLSTYNGGSGDQAWDLTVNNANIYVIGAVQNMLPHSVQSHPWLRSLSSAVPEHFYGPTHTYQIIGIRLLQAKLKLTVPVMC